MPLCRNLRFSKKNLKFSFVDYMENTNFTHQTHIHGENVH